MAEVAETKAHAEEVVAEKTTIEKEAPPAPEVSEAVKTAAVVEEVVEAEKAKPAEEVTVTESVSFKEESNVVADLPENEKKALEEFKQLIQQALEKHEFTSPPPPPAPVKEEEKKEEEKKEETKDEEKPAEEKVVCAEEVAPADPAEEKPAETTEPPKVETEPEPTKEAKADEKTETVLVVEVVETVTATVDDDGAKTVEAIKETVVAISSSSAPEEPAEAEKAAEEAPAAPAEPEKEEEEVAAAPLPPPEEVSIWGIPLLKDERSDVILLKFLRARDFKVKDAFTMIKNAVRWREEFGIEALLEEDLGNDFDKAVFMHGVGKDDHPVCYNVYQKTFSEEEKRKNFLRWRIQFLEKSIRKLDFSPNGINTIIQVNDLKNLVVPGLLELRHALYLLQDNYPEFLAKQVNPCSSSILCLLMMIIHDKSSI
uniref:CRAL/TRIO N-terminal domain-containing protein n=1 Tax=Nelumbo nucifera TaxID=4432 RepID=A0A822Z6N0_NELNU|nr:TPA_asm: hypothetical protein HUJ06_013362 [Nelumbo nucifera]